jgi:hypothetical protein
MIRRGGVVLLMAVVVGCGGDGPTTPITPPPPPNRAVPGLVGVSVASPNSDDGAMLFSVSGQFQSIQAANGYQVLSYAPTTTVTKVMVVGPIVSGTVFSLNVADKSLPVGVTIDQVAARASYAQRTPSGYRVTIVR